MSNERNTNDFGWSHTGRRRPPFAVTPAEGQTSVWDHPRPPALLPEPRRVLVMLGTVVVADSSHTLRLLETAHPPTFYIPPQDVDQSLLQAAPGTSWCEWKGQARYWSVVVPAPQPGGAVQEVSRVAWSYTAPLPAFAALRDHLAFYIGELSASVGGVPARAQAGGFYGGWITPDVVGPFKGDAGTSAW